MVSFSSASTMIVWAPVSPMWSCRAKFEDFIQVSQWTWNAKTLSRPYFHYWGPKKTWYSQEVFYWGSLDQHDFKLSYWSSMIWTLRFVVPLYFPLLSCPTEGICFPISHSALVSLRVNFHFQSQLKRLTLHKSANEYGLTDGLRMYMDNHPNSKVGSNIRSILLC